MNHIKRLTLEKARLEKALKHAEDSLVAMQAHLLLPKFHGEGNRWINISDVDSQVASIRSELTTIQCEPLENFDQVALAKQ